MQAALTLSKEQVRPHRRHGERKLPWKNPYYCVWFVIALLLSGWLTVNMPNYRPPARTAVQTQTVASGTPALQASAPHLQQAKSGMHGPKKEQTALSRLEHRARIFGKLFFFVGVGALLGTIIEGRCWYRIFTNSLGRIARAARLPNIVGIAMPTAFASSAAADSMLVASHGRGEISNTALIAGGMLNSFFSHLSHSLRVMYPVIAAIGLPGVIYFLIQLGGGALTAFGVLVWHRLVVARKEAHYPDASPASIQQAGGSHDPLPWNKTLRKGILRALSLLFRLSCVSVPMILAMEWIIRSGALDFWDQMMPQIVSQFIPEQLLTIMAAQIGGLIQSATVSAGLLAEHLITGPQVLLAMLISSAASNPIRTLRRNLPTALAIFPMRTALIIVLGMQLARFIIVVTAAILLMVWMQMNIA